MARKARPIPEGFHTITPYLVVRDAARAVEFYQKAFGAKARNVSYMPDGKRVMHAELKIGDSILMLNDEFPEWHVLSPKSRGGSSVTIHMYVKDVDAAFQRAVSAGATVTMPVMDAFWGDRYGQLEDPSGHKWSLATHKEDLTPAQMKKRAEAFFAEMAKKQGASG